jgi:hypothetical protein
VQHIDHIWRKVVDGTGLGSPISGEVVLDGFSPGLDLKITWYNFTTQGIPTLETSDLRVDSNGQINLLLPNDPRYTDIGILIDLAEK